MTKIHIGFTLISNSNEYQSNFELTSYTKRINLGS
uniref:Uncharacterized protein n=1 Tax=Anguilla anguilla TaxID=7936 RepID=A0A0E9RK59_ANGAN